MIMIFRAYKAGAKRLLFAYGEGVAVGFKEGVSSGEIKVMSYHLPDHLIKGDFRYPAKISFGSCRVTKQGFNL